ncbi:MAG: protein translocase subunit SecF [Eubacteriaceae bacterium]|jgi:preprotein translocase subunit SecF|nr:protein translocase subunit SecF [Eubacteriaceae bacterium]
MKNNFKIIEKTKIWFILSGLMLLLTIGSFLVQGLNYGIDFLGGTIITIDLHQHFKTEDARKIVDPYDKGADITYAGDDKTNIIIGTKENLDEKQRKEIFEGFKKEYGLEDKDLLSIDTISPTIGGETAKNAALASTVVVVMILVYITFRFQFFFGLAAVSALIHDVIIMIGVYSFFRIPVNSPFIAAILTILGYSINDTIVVFDRIRENSRLYKKMDVDELVNRSINQSLRRSVNTTLTTLMAVTSLYIFGGVAIRDFALPLIVGLIIGCYSSIFVASPIWVLLEKKFPHSRFTQKAKRVRG